MSSYRAGQSLRLTNDGRVVTIWSPAHLPGTYWCHLGKDRRVVLVRVRQLRSMPLPEVTLVVES